MTKLKCLLVIKLVVAVFVLGMGLNAHAEDTDSNKITVMSWNVWFDKKSGETRYPKLFDEVDKLSPDIVFLQEVTPSVIRSIRKHAMSKYFFLNVSDDANSSYGQAFLTKKTLLLSQEYALHSQYGRDAVFGLYEIDAFHAAILVNVHLESGLREIEAREEQIAAIQNSLLPAFRSEAERHYPEKSINYVIWGGDFNLGYTELPDGIDSFVDVGKKFDDNTPTYHVDNNKLANYTASWFEDSARLDRMFISDASGMSALSYKVINSDYYSTLSDHYPIHVVLGFESVEVSR